MKLLSRIVAIALVSTGIVVLAGCGHGAARPAPTATSTAVPGVSSLGTVVGGIEPCVGLGPISGLRFAAGTVTVYRGRTWMKPLGHGTFQTELPKHVVTRQTVGRNRQYRFRLPPGRYVIQARYRSPANVRPWKPVTVRKSTVVHANIPNV